MQLRRERFDRPDEVRPFERGRIEVVELGELVIGRATFEPGWRWSEHVKPIAVLFRQPGPGGACRGGNPGRGRSA